MAELKLKYVEEFTVAGKLGHGKADEGPQWIVPLWEEANGSYSQIQDIVLKNESGAQGNVGG
ncbi:hypothetical protein HMSSN036_29090 [Paenibacillus macerans]|nr:hypothetical protein HMSSN036_29090 [Paenibacillus macerans]